MRVPTAITILFLWVSCYLNCTTGLFAQLSEEIRGGDFRAECSTCPHDQPVPEEQKRPCGDCDSIAKLAETETFSPKLMESRDTEGVFHASLAGDSIRQLVLLNQRPKSTEALFSCGEPAWAHISRPIRGPAV